MLNENVTLKEKVAELQSQVEEPTSAQKRKSYPNEDQRKDIFVYDKNDGL